MAILARIFRLFRADMHAVLDQLEDQRLLLKQHLRDMEECLLDKESRLKQMCFMRDQGLQNYERGRKESNDLEQDLEVAIQKDRDDIARMLIKKLKPLHRIQSERDRYLDRLNHEIEALKEDIAQQRLQFEQLRQQAAEFFHRSVTLKKDYSWPTPPDDFNLHDLSPEEIEIELLQRKEALKGGATSCVS